MPRKSCDLYNSRLKSPAYWRVNFLLQNLTRSLCPLRSRLEVSLHKSTPDPTP
ncbi:MAG: hypothetical protein F6J93_24735 [Oscillatoria sp. SIO1A7]|nr:hypothetical protein [Oscillatoria sp. SIO1A7]